MSVMEALSLLDRLPQVRGRLTANAPLGPQSWFRVGGAAEVLFKPADREDLAEFLAALPSPSWERIPSLSRRSPQGEDGLGAVGEGARSPAGTSPSPTSPKPCGLSLRILSHEGEVGITVLGAASNVLIRDGGIPGVVIRLTACAAIKVNGEIITTEAGALDTTIAQFAQEHALTGLEFLSGIPGSLGGAVVMNAGCYGSEIADRLVDVDIMRRDGSVETWGAGQLGLSYRHSTLPPDAIVLSARLLATPGDPAKIAATMAAIKAERSQSQPTRARTGGSTFANPPGHKAWQLIDAAGCRGLTVGGAQMSAQHCNFMLNTGTATAADLETLGEEVRRRVFATSGVDLRWEIKRLGVFS